MRKYAAALLSLGLLAGCAQTYGDHRMHAGWDRYDYNRPDPGYGGYEADRYYRADRNSYSERQVSQDERIYRGHDGRYYCRHSDGSTGLIVGAVAGGVLGNVIAPGGSEMLGTVLGAIAGGAVGHSIDRNSDVRCR
ncbi:glycine zipper 2TM domain-containing protein [Novosphingobium sp.]|uniref:glycine zipper 2TM domain-containing protein n=1 Tax=Novosphingobium sp. TaxID=1874826 RepID=UPI00333E5255